MIKNKKGIFITFIALAMVAALMVFLDPSSSNFDKDIESIKSRVGNLNNIVLDLERVYFERSLQASGTKAIHVLIEHMESTDEFLWDFNEAFQQVAKNGTLNGTTLMENGTFEEFLERAGNITRNQMHSNVNFTILGVSGSQIEPWYVLAEANVSLKITSEIASWDKNISVRSNIPITYFMDPYVSVNTIQTYTRKINRTETKNVEWNISSVEEHIEHGTYVHFDEGAAPSFIMRFENRSEASPCCGIQSIIDPNLLGNSDQMESYVDYLFFNHTFQGQCSELYNTTELSAYDHLKVDIEHLFLYNLSNYAYVRSCP